MFKIGSVWGPSGGARPNGVQVSFITGKCEFFMGDRWIFVGPVMAVQRRNGFTAVLPDFNKFFEDRKVFDDGSEEWRAWGPRVN